MNRYTLGLIWAAFLMFATYQGAEEVTCPHTYLAHCRTSWMPAN